MEECCKNCNWFTKLSHNFSVGNGFENSHCCVVFAKEKEGFVVETTENDMCEMFFPKNKTKKQ